MQVAFQAFQLREWAFSRTVTDHHAKVNSQIHKLHLPKVPFPWSGPALCKLKAWTLCACKIQSKFFISLIAYMSCHGERKEVNLSIYIFVSITIANVNRTIIHCGDIILRRTRTAVKNRYFFNRNVFYISLEEWKLSTFHPRRRKLRENSLLRANNGLTASKTKRCNFIALFLLNFTK